MDVWTGGAGVSNPRYSAGANWSGGIAPLNNGLGTLNFPVPVTNGFMEVDISANVQAVYFYGSPAEQEYDFQPLGGGTLTIGSGGISSQSGLTTLLFNYVPTVLSASQIWDGTGGYIFDPQQISETGGARMLTTRGDVYLLGSNTFTGGVTVATGRLFVETPTSAGVSGTITLDDNTSLQTWFEAVNLANPVSLGNNVTFGNNGFQSPQSTLTLSGNVTASSSSTTFTVNNGSAVIFAGNLGGSAPTTLTIDGYGPKLPSDGGSQVVVQGLLDNVTGIDVEGASLILAPSGSVSASYSGLSASGVTVGSSDDQTSYLGFDGAFATTSGSVAAFLSAHGPGGSGLYSNFFGTLGFDTFANPGTPNTFSGPIDLSGFSSANFIGLGSSTAAILSGTLTPVSSTNTYPFGGGGGTLTLSSTSSLPDNGGTTLTMTGPTPEPLTLILQGNNAYSGGTFSYGGVLIFDSPTPGTPIHLGGGYVGYTEHASDIDAAQTFVNLFQISGQGGVIGFDSADPMNPRAPIGYPIDLSAFNSDNNPFIGTATSATLTGMITPAANTYQFTGVKGGSLTISSALTGTAGVVIGLSSPIETNGSESTVNITPTEPGSNTYSGGTTFNSGELWINSDNALGLGTISVPDSASTIISPFLAPFGSPTVTLANPIALGSIGTGPVTPGLEIGDGNSGAAMLVLTGVISDYPAEQGLLSIDGPVTLTNANTYSGGTNFTGSGNAVILVGNNSALGSGPITLQAQAVLAPAGGPVTLGNSIVLNDTLTLGQFENTNSLTLNGVISGYNGLVIDGPVALTNSNTYSGGTNINDAVLTITNPNALGTGPVDLSNASVTDNFSNPSFLDLQGTSESSVNLVPDAVLTLNTDTNAISPPADYSGAINGDSTNQVMVTGTGVEELTGSSTYGGGTTVVSGRLIAGAPMALGSGGVTVNGGAGLEVSNPTVITNALTLAPGATVSGGGTFSPPGGLTIAGSGTAISPGSDGIFSTYVDTLSFGTPLAFGAGGQYLFDVQDASGAAGVGYDTINVTGLLTISGAPFTIMVRSITPGGFGSLGPAATFNPAMSYTWTLVNASGGISMFNAADFSINTSSFQNSLAGGNFMVGESGNMLTLNFTPVPEPSTWALMAGGLGVVLFVGIRRTRRA
jgi:hypothetical protein